MNSTENYTEVTTSPEQTISVSPDVPPPDEIEVEVDVPRVTWYNGKHVLEIDFCEEFLADNPMHYIDGVFYNLDGAVPDGVIEKKITEKLLAARVQKKFSQTVKALMDALRRICFVADYQLPDDEIHVQNGYLKTDGTFYTDKKFCRNRLCVNYNPNAPKPVRWLKFLDELLAPEDILTLQEFMGYCLINSTKAQAMLFIIGNGGEGKSRIGVVMYRLFNESAYFGSINELASDKFLKANLIGKTVLIDDDMNLDGLRDTSFLKSLATSETPLTVQAKGKQGIQVRLSVRTICFSNGAPKSLYDKTEGWERRLVILSAKPVPKNRVNDPFLSEKLVAELEGIFLWAFEGLKRLIANNFRISISDNARKNIAQMKEDNCNIISFMKDEQLVKFGADLECSSADLYCGYCYWCSLNGVLALKRESFNLWLKQNYTRYDLQYSEKIISHSTQKYARGYRGVDTTFRSVLK